MTQRIAKCIAILRFQSTQCIEYRAMESNGFMTLFADTIFPIRQGMRDQSVSEWNKASKFTLFLVFVINLTLGIGGFVNFRRFNLPGNLFKRERGEFVLWNDDWWSHGTSWMLVGLMVMTVPLCVHVSREYVQAIITKLCECCNGKEVAITSENAMRTQIESGRNTETVIAVPSNGERESESHCEPPRHGIIRFAMKFKMTPLEYLVTFYVFAAAMILSILLKAEDGEKSKGISMVMDAVGDIGCSGMAFLLPPIIFLRTFRRKEYSLFCFISIILVFALGVAIWFQMIAKWAHWLPGDETKVTASS